MPERGVTDGAVCGQRCSDSTGLLDKASLSNLGDSNMPSNADDPTTLRYLILTTRVAAKKLTSPKASAP